MLGRPSRSLRTSVQQVADFWSWWSQEGRSAGLAMIRGDGTAAFVAAITARTDAIDSRLTWHTEPGAGREHRLVLSAAGAIEARAAAERWRRAAPSDPDWEFATSRRGEVPAEGSVLAYAGVELPLDAVRFRTARFGRLLDVVVIHPAAGAATAAGQGSEVAMLVLDLVLGEDEVERRVGHLELRSGTEGLTAGELVDQVRALREEAAWSLAHATYRDGSVAVIQVAPHRHPLDHLPFDRHSLVRIRYRARPDGLADRPEVVRVQDEQAELERLLGGLGTVVATEMHRGVRSVHVYSDAADRNATDVIDRFRRSRRGVQVRHRRDPEWRAMGPFTAIGGPTEDVGTL